MFVERLNDKNVVMNTMYMSNDCMNELELLVHRLWWLLRTYMIKSTNIKEVKSQCDENVLMKIVYKIGNAKKV